MEKLRIYLTNVYNLTQETFDRVYRTLPKPRREKIDRLKETKDKRLSLGAGALLERALKDFNLKSESVFTGKNGKPYIKGNGVFISLSHSGDISCCAVCGREVGCDIQKIGEYRERAAKLFTEREKEYLENSADRLNAFYRLWTLKESYIKNLGENIFRLSEEIIGKDGAPKVIGKTFYETETEGYKLACCVSTSEPLLTEFVSVDLEKEFL